MQWHIFERLTSLRLLITGVGRAFSDQLADSLVLFTAIYAYLNKTKLSLLVNASWHVEQSFTDQQLTGDYGGRSEVAVVCGYLSFCEKLCLQLEARKFFTSPYSVIPNLFNYNRKMSTTTQITTQQVLQPQTRVTESTKTEKAKSLRLRSKKPISSDTFGKRKINRNEAFSRPSAGDRDETPSTKKFIIEKEPIAFSSSSWEKSQHSTKRAGEYLLGPKQGSSPYLARKDGTDEFYIIKAPEIVKSLRIFKKTFNYMLTMKEASEKETMDDIQGKTLLHTEHSLSSLLKYEDGVVHEHGMFRSTIDETHCNDKGEIVTKEVTKLCLVLDCYLPHDFSPKYSHITNMQYYVIKEKKLPEAEAIRIFYKVVQIVERLHKLNIVHRDLKLGNIILNKDTGEVTLANFCLGKHLTSDNDLLKDQRGSPAYISPDVIIGKPYLGKPSDMWALGVVLYTMCMANSHFTTKVRQTLPQD
ncbi:Serine/threonine-protein kinase 40 [Orchesella cincta]|uniref:Serine/threonine-protein kinase 40 n=1 Tax=Orchesella cincta TaxID=48709 RepID=A0A1D2M252_ORCCI|nr:Serine/threonine-protein kinase 40 [Orchesella cincta]